MKVLVDSATRNSSLAVIRGLADEGYYIIGADERRLPFDTHSCFTEPYHSLPGNNPDSYIQGLMDILDNEQPDVFLPGVNVRLCSEHQADIRKKTHLLIPENESFETAFDKQKTTHLCQSLNIECPALLSEQEARSLLSGSGSTKIVIKPGIDIGGARGLTYVEDESELSNALSTAAKFSTPIIQKYIPGPSSNMRTVNLMFDKAGNLAAYFTTKKYREWPSTGGVTILSESTNDRHLVDWLLPLFKELHWQGPVEVEIKINANNGNPQVIEINPRFCGYIGFAIECGVNMASIACKLSVEKRGTDKRALPTYTTGLKYIHTSSFIRMAIQTVTSSPNKTQTLRTLLEEWRGKKVGNNTSWQDWQIILIKALFEVFNKGDDLNVSN